MAVRSQKPWRPPEQRRLGRYRLLAEIARGGIGAVYVGSADGPTGFRKLVAIKTVRPDLADEPALVRMLLDEARLASRLQHPNIAQLYDLGEDDGPYLVMEYVHGESLAAVMAAAGALPPRIGLWIAAQICDALAYAHELRDERDAPLGLVHRDVSPQNILVGYEGVPRLVDFGIARARHRSTETEAGVIKGRFAYMAPEQRAGRAVDGRTDLHALGMVLYQATVGVHPWELAGADAETDRVPDPRPHRPGYPDALWRLIARATATDPAQRFDSAAVMLGELREVAAGLGAAVDRAELATLLDAQFAARRSAKQKLLDGGSLEGDTEILDSAAGAATPLPGASGPDRAARAGDPETSPARGEQAAPAEQVSATLRVRRRPARPRTALLAGLALGAAGAGLLAAGVLRFADRGGQAPAGEPGDAPAAVPANPVAGAGPRRLCLLAGAGGSLTERDASWVAVRLFGRALDRHPTLEPVHGYRAQDREGWNPAGRQRAELACVGVGARITVDVTGAADGSMRARLNGETVEVAAGNPIERSIELAVAVAGRLGAATRWRTTPLHWPARLVKPLLSVHDGLALQKPDPRRRFAFESLTAQDPALEYTYLAEVITRWWAGEFDDPPARAALPRPKSPSARTDNLLSAIANLAAGAVNRADHLAASTLEDQRWADDPLTLYIAGEARVHAGRPAEGARLLERALTLDPQLTPAIYHVFDRRLAEGDIDGVERMAALWERVNPGSSRALEMRAQAALGAGRYADAIRMFESLLDRSQSDAASLHRPTAGLIHARLLGGDVDGALSHAREVAANLGEIPGVTAVLPDPIGYGFALGRGDQPLAAEWEARVRERMASNQTSPNYWQLAYSMAIIDRLAGRDGGRARWVGAGPAASVPRRYRFEPQARMLAVLDAAATDDRAALVRAAGADGDLPAQHTARAAIAEREGRLDAAADQLESAIGASAGGELHCVAAAALVRVHTAAGRPEPAAAACRRILTPRVPSPYCLAARRACAPAAPR